MRNSILSSYLAEPLPHVRAIPPYPPGQPIGAVAREFGLDPAGIVKLASNENPHGCSTAATSAIAAHAASVNLYPDFYCHGLRHAIGRHVGVSAEHVIPFAAGSSEVILLAARAYVDRDRSAIIPQYSFHSFRASVQSVGAESIIVKARDWMPDLDAMLAAVTARTHLMYLHRIEASPRFRCNIMHFRPGLTCAAIALKNGGGVPRLPGTTSCLPA